MTPPPLMNFSANNDQPAPNGVRIPTPIYGHFTSTDVNMDTSEASLTNFIHPCGARSQFRSNHNTLSPMMSEENESDAGGDWWARARLPSPAQSPVLLSQRMETDELAMDALSFENIACHNMQMEADTIDSDDNAAADSRKRSGPQAFLMARRPGEGQTGEAKRGKLVMGYRADCDKCVKRLPRHYSHIIWD